MLLKLVKAYEIAMVFSFLCFLVKLSLMVKQWNTLWLWDMWYYVFLFISFVSVGTYGSFGGRLGFQCVVRNFILRSLCVEERWLGWEPLSRILIKYNCVWPCCRHVPRFKWEWNREVVRLDRKGDVWKFRSRHKEHEKFGKSWGWLLRLWRWDERGWIWRLVEHIGWYNVGFCLENGFMVVKLQVIRDYERFKASGLMDCIIRGKAAKTWICLRHRSAYLDQISGCGYKALGNKSICNGVIESGVLLYLEFLIIFIDTKIYQDRSSGSCDEVSQCYYYFRCSRCVWDLMACWLQNFLMMFLVIRIWRSSWEFVIRTRGWNIRLQGYYTMEKLRWRDLFIQLVKFLNFGLTKWKRDVGSSFFIGIFKPKYSSSTEQSNIFYI